MFIQNLSAIHHIIENAPRRIERLEILSTHSQRAKSLLDLARSLNIPCSGGKRGSENGEPLGAYLKPFEYLPFEVLLDQVRNAKAPSVILALDHLQDPQNFGAICRSTEAMGVAGLLIPKDRSISVTEGVYSASVGAVETIPIVRVTNLSASLRTLKENEYWICGTGNTPEAYAPWKIPVRDRVVLVMGAEHSGISHGLEKAIDFWTSVPLSGKVESLNVSVAAALLIYELRMNRGV